MAALTVYDAAAGSGKTYTLVRNYLLKVLSSNNKNRYKQILAVTFTNKAVAEMKNRILESLYGFSQKELNPDHESMFFEIVEALGISAEALQQKSKETLHYLLHNYTAFSVQTIDKFTQSVIRTFAFDLNLATNFEIELDQKSVLELAVDELINQVGIDEKITEIVLNFARTQINEDAVWNIKDSLLKTAEIIFKEDDIEHIQPLSEHSFNDFKLLNTQTRAKIASNKIAVKEDSQNLLSVFEAKGIITEFNRNTIPNFFKKLEKDLFAEYKPTEKWKNNIEDYDFYTKGNKNEAAKQAIDDLKPQIIDVFYTTKKMVLENQFLQLVQKNIVQMSLLKSVNDKLKQLKKDKQFVLISDLNKLIFDTIKNQPTPFIYERLGERYKDFFIDEFQDTSVLQWQNLLPLADNAVSSLIENTDETGSVTLVGDAKQAIYRWRGGKAEQFMELSNGKNPFASGGKNTISLGTNYRSYSNIIQFNNLFFSYLSSHFNDSAYAELYLSGNQQNRNHRSGGYVQFDFVNAANAEEKNELYPEKVAETIDQILSNGFLYSDICILVRKNAEGVEIAKLLNEKQIPVLSYEALLVKNSNEVELLMTLTEFSQTPIDKKKKLEFLKSLAIHFKIKELHSFLSAYNELDRHEINTKLREEHGVDFSFNCFSQQSLYEAYESLIRAFSMNLNPNANLQFFLDFVHEYVQKKNAGIFGFIDYWNLKKDRLSIVVPEGKNAVQIMSIHKSKGLEFPVVIYPYADTDIYKKKPDNVWFAINEFSETFAEAYIKYNETVFKNYTEATNTFAQKTKQLQELDNFNVLYVALTRAKEQLYVISNYKEPTQPKVGEFQYYFRDFLDASAEFNKKENLYYSGSAKRLSISEQLTSGESLTAFISSSKESRGIHVVTTENEISTERKKSIDIGLFVHDLMSKIYDRADAENVLNEFKKKHQITEEDFLIIEKNIKQILNHEELNELFNSENQIFNERDFVHNGELLRPDRVEILKDKTVFIMDYKTGLKNDEYHSQLMKYGAIFNDDQYKSVKKMLIYLGKHININKV